MRNKPRLMELFHKAMEIWTDLPDIPLVHNIHRIPMNTTYWQNWPTAETPYVNGAFWHLTYAMVLWNLQPTQDPRVSPPGGRAAGRGRPP